jgi:alpha-mannosidase
MKYDDLLILLPCHSLEDFPTHHSGDDAAGLLAGWSALWHPDLIASTQKMPSWFRADSPPDALANKLVIVPGVSEPEIPADLAQRAQDHGAVLIRGQMDRHKILEQALAPLEPTEPTTDPDLAADFLALGYCFLQVQLLTRQMRYSSNLDEFHFQRQLVDGATAAVGGDTETARQRLSRCFDVLAEERDHYYPVEACILDMTMIASTTLGRALREQLESDLASNLFLSGELLDRIVRSEPGTLAAMKQAAQENRLGLIGGEYTELRTPLLSCETIRHQLLHGLARFEEVLACRPRVFGRRRFGLAPMLPQILQNCGFEGALHATLEEGAFPEGSQTKVRWEGCDGTAVDAIARTPLDANKPGTYLNYSIKMGESMDMDHVATICLAHWPGQISPWYEDLRRIAKYSAALGKFVTIEHFFRDTDLPVHQDRFRIDQYRAPYLKQAVLGNKPDAVSGTIRYWQRRTAAEAAHSLDTLTTLVAGSCRTDQTPATPPLDQLLATIDQIADEPQTNEASGDQPATAELSDTSGSEIDDQIRVAGEAAALRFAACLPRASQAAEPGYLVLNPQSFVRRIGLEMPRLETLPGVERPVYAAAEARGTKHVVVDVPPMGFVWVTAGPASPGKDAANDSQLMAEECLLRNEFFEVLIDPASGGLRAIREYNSRTNRMSQQLAKRLASPPRRKSGAVWQEADLSKLYSVMIADSILTTISTPIVGEIVARGRLEDARGTVLAHFQQTYRLWRGSRVLQMDIQLDPQGELNEDPWNSYYAARFAWASEAADLRRAVNMTRLATSAKRFETPHFVEIEDGGKRTAILTGGVPFHSKPAPRMLDSLLIVRGEQGRKFRMGIGLDLKNPLHEALSLHTPVQVLFQSAPPPIPSRSGWLFHIDARNVTATHWEPLLEGDDPTGFRVRLLETAGRAVKMTLSSFRPVAHARQRGLDGSPRSDCILDEGRVTLQMAAHQWTEIEASW